MHKSVIEEIKILTEQNQALDLSCEAVDFPVPEMLIHLTNIFIKKGCHNFAPVFGTIELRKQIARLISDTQNLSFDPEKEITVTTGIIQTVSAIISTFINEGDEVILFEPSSTFYNSAINLKGGSSVFVPMKEPHFEIDWEEVRKMISSKTKMIILNSPNNPTGKVLSEEDLLQLQKFTTGTNIIVVSTEHFEHLTFDNKQHLSVAKYEKILPKCFVVSSLGPVFNINGWGIAWCYAKEPLMNEFRKVHYHQISYTNNPMQCALAEYLKTYSNDFSDITEFYQGKRNYFNRLLKDTPYKILPTKGTYFQLIDFSAISDESDIDFAKTLITKNKVAVMPLSTFLTQKNKTSLLRINFAKENNILEKAAELLTKNI